MSSKSDNVSPIRVLVVEDEAILAEEIQERLRAFGHESVGIVDNGPAAIEQAQRLRPDLILMDIRLKGPMDGIETATRIYERLQLPIVYVTAHADEATLQRAKVTAQFGYVVKPFQERELRLAVDIAVQRHRAERSLQEGRLTYATILASVTDAVIATDEAARVRFLNRVAETLTGWRFEDALGLPVETVMELLYPSSDEKVEDPLTAVLRGSAPASLDKLRRLKSRNGRSVPVEVSNSSVQDVGGNVIGAVAVLRDVTELKRAEERFRSLLESAPDAMVIVDPKGKILLVNSRAERVFGYPRSELIGNDVEMLIPERMREQQRANRDRSQGAPWSAADSGLELRGRRKNGTEFPIEISLSPLETDEGRIFSSAIRDITDRKQAETEHLQLEAQLRQAQKMDAIGTLAGGIAHDFNNILTAILGNVELCRWEIDEPESLAASLDEIAKAANRAKNLVRQILAFSRQESLHRVVLSLGPVVDECLSLLRATIPAGVQLQKIIEPEIPEVLADATQIHQVLLNLCTNAWHSLPEKGGRIVIALESVEVKPDAPRRVPGLASGRHARLSVQDNGHGMDESTKAKAFEPFFTTKGPGKGTGLGLSVVLGIVQSHGGVIDLRSEPGAGTVVELYFPAVSPAQRAQLGSKPPLLHGKGERILFIDDEQPLLRVATRILERLGYRVVAFDRAERALLAFTAAPDEFAAVITDFNMPGMSGLEFAREVLRIRPKMGVILSSGFVSDELTTRARDLGINRILLKPNHPEELSEALKAVCTEPAKRP